MSRLLASVAALTLLTACGIQGNLERPNPLWGGQQAIDVECRREREHHERLDRRCNPPPAQQSSSAPAAPVSPTAPENPVAGATTTP